MQTSNDDLGIPQTLLTLAFFAVTEFFIHRNRDVFLGLVNYSTDENSNPHVSADFSNSQIRSDRSELIFDHLTVIKKILSIQSLPFLPDEVHEEFSLAKIQNKESWKEILAIFPDLFLKHEASMNSRFYEEIDCLFVTFVEWMEDVDFLSASEAARSSYLQEFPFDAKIGAEI
jgi:hypothetical protein